MSIARMVGVVLVALFGGGFFSTADTIAPLADERDILVEVRAIMPDGSPADGLMVHIRAKGRKAIVSGSTDANGVRQQYCEVQSGDTEIAVCVDRAAKVLDSTDRPEVARQKLLLSQVVWPSETISVVADTAEGVTVAVQGGAKARVRGRITGLAAPVNAFAVGCGTYESVKANPDGTFVFTGLPRNRKVWLGIMDQQAGYAKMVPVTTSALENVEVDVGDVEFVRASGTGKVTIEVLNEVSSSEASWRSRLGVTLLRDDGSAVFWYQLPSSKRVQIGRDGSGTTGLPAGVYFVVPSGLLAGGPDKALELLSAGRGADMIAAGIPRVTVVAGEEANLSIQAGPVWRALIGLWPD